MHKEILLILATLFMIGVSSPAANAQNSITGIVRSAKTNKPLLGANVFLNGTLIGTTTNKFGKFTLNGIPDGTHTLVISYIGYKTYKTNITIPRKRINFYSFY